MDRLVRFNVLAMSGRAVEAAGDVDVLLLDKTGTITIGDRQASEFVPVERRRRRRAGPTRRNSPRWRTRRRRAAPSSCSRRRRTACAAARWPGLEATFVPFTAQTRMSGVDIGDRRIRKGAVDSVLAYVQGASETTVRDIRAAADRISKSGGTPLAVADGHRLLGVSPPEGRGEGRHPRPLRRTAPHGHPHRDDHRRQPADGGGHRRRERRRRLSSRRPRRKRN